MEIYIKHQLAKKTSPYPRHVKNININDEINLIHNYSPFSKSFNKSPRLIRRIYPQR